MARRRLACWAAPALAVAIAALLPSVLETSRLLQQRQRTRLIPRVYELTTCPNRTTGFVINNMTIAMDENGADYVILDYNINKPMTTISKMTIPITKCVDGVGASQCEYYMTWSWNKKLCQFMQAKGVLWTPLVESTVPEFRCPFQGRYVAHNGTLDLNVLDKVMLAGLRNVQNHIFKAEVQLYDQDDFLNMCFAFVLEIRRMLIRPAGHEAASSTSSKARPLARNST